jgi:4-alpha-glucanotransferase
MNVPGWSGGTWAWRWTEELLTDPDLQFLAELTSSTNRLSVHASESLTNEVEEVVS